MATPTHLLIATQTVGSNVTTVTFSSIPSTYTDLLLKISARTNSSTSYEYMYINFNGGGYNAPIRFIQFSGSGAGSTSSESTGYLGITNGNGATASVFSNNEVYIPSYAGSNYKSFSVDGTMENNATASYMHYVAGIWQNTSAINSVAVQAGNTQSFVQYSTFSLYGIKNS
jgi:hypothetical protein